MCGYCGGGGAAAAAFSTGTLSYIFNTYGDGRPFSEIVSDAKSKGYTEPDPRDDLNGTDVARKVRAGMCSRCIICPLYAMFVLLSVLPGLPWVVMIVTTPPSTHTHTHTHNTHIMCACSL